MPLGLISLLLLSCLPTRDGPRRDAAAAAQRGAGQAELPRILSARPGVNNLRAGGRPGRAMGAPRAAAAARPPASPPPPMHAPGFARPPQAAGKAGDLASVPREALEGVLHKSGQDGQAPDLPGGWVGDAAGGGQAAVPAGGRRFWCVGAPPAGCHKRPPRSASHPTRLRCTPCPPPCIQTSCLSTSLQSACSGGAPTLVPRGRATAWGWRRTTRRVSSSRGGVDVAGSRWFPDGSSLAAAAAASLEPFASVGLMHACRASGSGSSGSSAQLHRPICPRLAGPFLDLPSCRRRRPPRRFTLLCFSVARTPRRQAGADALPPPRAEAPRRAYLHRLLRHLPLRWAPGQLPRSCLAAVDGRGSSRACPSCTQPYLRTWTGGPSQGECCASPPTTPSAPRAGCACRVAAVGCWGCNSPPPPPLPPPRRRLAQG